MQVVSEKLTQTVGRTILQLKKQSPHILFAGGIVGIIGSTILACRATLKLEKNLDEIKEDFYNVKDLKKSSIEVGPVSINGREVVYTDRDYYKDMVTVYAKSAAKIGVLYGPSIIIGGLSIAALTGSHIQLSKRNAALSSTLALVSKAYDEYRIRVREEVGEEKELDIYHGVKSKEIEVDGKKKSAKTIDPNALSPYARFFDEYSTCWVKSNELNRIFLQCQQSYANHLLRARGHLFLNEVYDDLGLERSQAGAVVGWVIDGDGDGYVDFGIFEVENSRFVNGLERSILLDFNVDGVIYNKI